MATQSIGVEVRTVLAGLKVVDLAGAEVMGVGMAKLAAEEMVM